jgi:hypothetical protein
MRRPRPFFAWISALVILAAGLTTSAGCDDTPATAVCSGPSDCPSGQWCLYPDAECGKGSPAGTCTPVSELTCTASEVCGCDGKIYSSVCTAAQIGVDTTDATSCTAPAGAVACGGTYCDGATQLCSDQQTLAGGVCQRTIGCVPLPSACAASPTCACLAENGFGGTCTGDAASGFSVSAAGGC